MNKSAAGLALAAVIGCGARTDLPIGDEASGGSAAGPEACNGVDDNSNGEIDEGLGTIECGVGACRVSVPACEEGRPGRCVPGTGSAETCNGTDDDCNGAVDEGLPLVRVAGPYLLDPSLYYLANASIAVGDGGFFFAYSTGFDGGNPTTNVFWGTLDETGAPIETEQALTDRNMTNGLRISPASGGFFAAYCGRFGSEDRASTASISQSGVFSEFGVRPPSTNFCGAGTPDGIWTGERYLFAWTDNSNMDVRLDRADASGMSLSSELLSEKNGDLYSHPRFAMGDGRVLLSYSILRDAEFFLRVHRLDLLGQDVGEPMELAAPLPSSNWVDAQLAAEAAGGFYLLARGPYGDPFHARFDADGALVEGPTLGLGDGLSQHALIADPSGGYALVQSTNGDVPDSVVSRTDAAGAVTASWFGSLDPGWNNDFFGWPTVAVGNGRIVVVYTALGSGVPDYPELRAVTFGCQAGP